ncbi:hypothetical protein [Pseudomonas aeruginosa]|uniref:hypothetical protein n=1 Tax=Pseudomonas aeruginosa TaxID=287 RepID=UPI00259CE1B2|nr:hypothetical protein [Pseudomonas aeruginosa]MDM5016164.1 hypothetical protein [Pseudomonas aeruginosa]
MPDAAAALLPPLRYRAADGVDAAGAQHEIVKATARAGGVLTIERRQEGTTDGNWAAGTAIYAAVTAGDLMALQARIQGFRRPGRLAAPRRRKPAQRWSTTPATT